jgi:uncharacterized protein (TIGR00255 family)
MSMTGFGRAVADVQGRHVAVEVRSVNHRGLDVKVRGRGLSGAVEVEIVRAVRAALARGSVQVSVEEAPAERERADVASAEARTLDRVRGAHQALEQLRRELGLETPVDLATAVGFLRLDRERTPDTQVDLPWEALAPALHEALAALVAARAREGQLLAAELQARAARLSSLGTDLVTHTAPLAERAARRLSERLASALAATTPGAVTGAAIDPARLAQEVATLAERLDVSEELSRFEVHRSRLAELVAPGAGAPAIPGQTSTSTTPGQDAGSGRTLEFLLQELGRELNTLGSKAQDAEVSALVIAGKAELEKIREQAQNIE